jgi:predicted DNA-binding protein (MmcQ/YjbR family)
VTLDQYNQFCRALPHTAHVVQWGEAHVWKVSSKVFAIARGTGADEAAVTFKCSAMSFDLLKQAPGMRPAPYLASRGMLWLQSTSRETLDDAALSKYIAESHRLASLNLPRRVQTALGLNQARL